MFGILIHHYDIILQYVRFSIVLIINDIIDAILKNLTKALTYLVYRCQIQGFLCEVHEMVEDDDGDSYSNNDIVWIQIKNSMSVY